MIEGNQKKKGNLLPIIIIVLGLALIGVGVFFCLGTDKAKKDDKKENTTVQTAAADKYEGRYVNGEDKIYIRKTSNDVFHYMISGSFEGSARVVGDSAKETDGFSSSEYYEFKLVDGGIDLSYHNDDPEVETIVATGKYNKVSDYSKDNIYKEAIGNPELLNSKYSGVYKYGDITLYLYQTNEKNVKVETLSNSENYFSETFEIIEDNFLGSRDFFDEESFAYRISFADKSFSLTVNEEVFGFDEEDKAFEGTYNFVNSVTKDEILNTFYKNY